MAPVFMVNPKPKRNKAGQFVKKAAATRKPKAHTKRKPRAAASKSIVVIHTSSAKKGVHAVNPKRNKSGRFVKSSKTKTKRRSPAHAAKHRTNPKRATAHSAKHRTVAKRRHHRRNPKGQMLSVLKGALLPAMIFPTAAIAGDVLYGVLPLPASMRTGMMKPVGKLGVAALLGAAAAFMLPQRIATLVAGGLIGGVVYDMGKSYLQTSFPSLPLAGVYDYPGLEYENAGRMGGASPSFLGGEAPSFLGGNSASFGPINAYVESENVSAYVES